MQASVAQQNQILQLQIIDTEIMQAIVPYPSKLVSIFQNVRPIDENGC
jgi:galactose-1-phosphate uridylyltransferase